MISVLSLLTYMLGQPLMAHPQSQQDRSNGSDNGKCMLYHSPLNPSSGYGGLPQRWLLMSCSGHEVCTESNSCLELCSMCSVEETTWNDKTTHNNSFFPLSFLSFWCSEMRILAQHLILFILHDGPSFQISYDYIL